MVKDVTLENRLKTAAQIITAATTVVGVSVELKEKAQPLIDSDEGKAVFDKSKDFFGGLKAKASETKDSIGEAVDKASTAKSEHSQARAAKKKEKELAKQFKKARQIVLESASQVETYKDFAKLLKQSIESPDAFVLSPFSGPGCFAIATYSNLDFDKDLTDYLYIYVGRGAQIAEAVQLACSREGDPDLYADVKYKQNVQVYAYPCTGEEIDDKYEALASLFQSSDE